MPLDDLLNSVKDGKVLLDEVDRFLESGKKKPRGVINDDREKNVWHVSQLHGCIRAIMFQRFGFKSKDKVTAKGEKIFDTGHSFGYTAQEYLYYMDKLYGKWRCRLCGHKWVDMEEPSPRECPNCGEKLYIWHNLSYLEVPARDDELGIAGHADAVTKTKGKKRVVELKTIKNRTERTHPNSTCFEDLNEPKEGHLWQISMYMHLLDVRHGVIWYRGKNDQRDKEFTIRLQEELHIDPQIRKVKKLNEHFEEKTMPSRPEFATGKNCWDCKYCGYKDLCYSLDSEDLQDYREEAN